MTATGTHAFVPSSATAARNQATGSELELLKAASPSCSNEVIFIDQTLQDWQSLVRDVPPSAQVVLLDPARSGISQIAEALAGKDHVDAIHLLTHGGEGYMVLGNSMLSSYNLLDYQADLSSIKASLTPGADVLLYGCDIAKGEAGTQFVKQLSSALGADVAASTNDTGVRGDWALEYRSGAVEAVAISAGDYQFDLATIKVTNLNDSGAGSLRAAVVAATGNGAADTIVFDPALFASGAATITLTTGALDVHGTSNADAFTIIGPGENLLTISGNNNSRIFEASVNFATSNSSSTSISGMTLTSGLSTDGYGGGAINFSYSGSLTLDHIRITNSSATGYSGGGLVFSGGQAAYGGGSFTMLNSSITGNSSKAFGGGLSAVSSLSNASQGIYVSNSTISGNTAGASGGGASFSTNGASIKISNTTVAGNIGNSSNIGQMAGGGLLLQNATSTTVLNSTIVGNSSLGSAGKIYAGFDGGGVSAVGIGSLVLTNTIIANNISNTGVAASQDLMVGRHSNASGSNNLLTSVNVWTGTGPATNTMTGTITTLGSALGTLSNNGGAVQTIALATGSNAIGAGTTSGAPTTDARGFVRGASVDIGAYEFSDNGTFSFTGLVSPATGVIDVPANYNLSIDFGKAVSAVASKNIVIYRQSDNVVLETISASDTSKVTFSSGTGGANSKVTINPAATFAGSTGYYVLIDSGAFIDSSSKTFNGISSAAAWAFTSASLPAPTVTGVTAGTANGSYKVGSPDVSITVTFSSAVDVTGIPQLKLETGTVDRIVNYSGGSGTTTLTFTYQIQAGDTSGDLDYFDAAALSLNGGTIKAAGTSTNAVLTLATPGAANSLGANRSIVIDTTVPAAPGAPDLATGSDSGSSSTDNITSVTTPTFTGTAEAGSTVTLYDSDGTTSLGSAVATGGNWSITSSTLNAGVHTVTAKATDAAGNVSAASSALAVTVDTTAPATTIASIAFSADTGTSSSDFVTKTAAQTISGTTSANVALGEIVQVSLDNGSTWSAATTTVGQSTWSLATTLSASNTLRVRVTDAAGNSGTTASQIYVLDTSAPAAPGAPDLATASDSGSSSTDNITNITTPTFTGTAEAGSTVTLYDSDGTTSLGSAVATGGNWSITSSTLNAGVHTVTAKATDAAGNVSAASSALAVTVDTTAPATTIASIAFSADTGTSSSDFVTKTAAQTISGTTSANVALGEIVQVSLDNGSTWSAATTTVGQSTWSLATTLSASNTLRVRVTDAAGNSGTTASQIYVLDTSAPAAPGAPDLATASDSGSSSTDNITNITTPTFTGTAEAGSTVTLYDSDGTTSLGSAVATGGNWSITSSTLNAGVHTVTAKATDAAGNVSAASSALAVTVDATAPTAPSAPDLATASDSGSSSTDNLTNNTTPTFTGTAEAGSTVTLYDSDGTTSLGSAVATGGNWSITSSTLNAGVHTVTAKATDAAGNVSAASSALAVTVDATAPTAPSAPDLATASDSGSSSTDNLTNNTTPTFTGTAEAGSTVTLYDSDGTTSLGSATATGGNWSITSSTLNAGVHTVTAKATDAAGNVSTASTGLAVTVDTTAPTTTIASIAFSADTGTNNSDFITKTAAQTISGTTSANVALGEIVQVSLDNGSTWSAATTTVGQSTWSLTTTLTTSNTLKVRVTDAAGNSGTTASQIYVLDNSAPDSNSVNASTLDGTYKVGDAISVQVNFSEAVNVTGTPQLTLETGATDRVVNYAGGSGTSSLTFNYTVQAGDTSNDLDYTGVGALALNGGTIQDAAGNNSTLTLATPGAANSLGNNKAIVIDGVAPSVTSVAASVADGTYKAGDTVSVQVNFSEAVTITGTPQLTLETGTTDQVVNYSGGSGTTTLTFNYTVQAGDTSGDLDYLGVGALALNGGTIKDAAGNNGSLTLATPGTTNSLGANKAIVIDGLAPTLAITSNVSAVKSGETATVTFTFSEAPVGFASGDIVTTGGAISGLAVTADPKVYTATFTPTAGTASANASITVAAGLYADAAGNNGGAGTTPTIAIDTLAPTLAITSNVSAVKSGETATITFTFSEAPVGFASGDIVTTGGAISGLAVTADPKVYTATFTPTAGTASANASITVAAGLYADAAGNNGSAGTTPTIAIDTLAPTLAITSNVSAVKSGETATVTFTFSEAPVGFASGDIVTTGGAISGLAVTADPKVYTATFTPTAGTASANASITVAAGLYADAAGNNGGAGTTPTIAIDTLAPTLAITSNVSAVKSGETATVTFTFSEAPVGFASGDIVTTGGAISGLAVTADPKVYTATFTPTAGTASANASITVAAGLYADAAGNNGSAGTTPTIAIDTLAPAVASVNSSMANVTYKAGDTVSVQMTFNEAVTVTGTPQLTLETGATDQVANYTSGNGTNTLTFTYTVQAGDTSGDLDYQGVGALALNGGTIKDTAGNPGVLTLVTPGAANSLGSNKAIVIDGVAPTVTSVNSSTADGTYKAGDTISLQVNFSEAVTVTATPQLTLETGTTDQVLNYTGGSGTSTLTFSYTVQPGDVTGDLDYHSLGALALNGGTIKDAAGNAGVLTLATPGAANSLGSNKAIVIDGVAPTLGITSNVNALKSGETATVTFTFSEAPIGFASGDIAAADGAISGLAVTADPKVYTATFTPTAGTAAANASITVAAGLYADAAGNGGGAGTTPTIAIDALAPTVASVSSSTTNATYKIGDTVSVQVNFSEVVTITGTPQLTLETGATDRVVSYASGSGTSSLTFNYTVQPGDSSTDLDYAGASALALNGGTVRDAAGNTGTLTLATPGTANSLGSNKAIVIDGIAPTVTSVSSTTANGTYRAGDLISVQVNFSEAVTVTGTPQLTLETGTADRIVNYASGSGTTTLTFNYTVQAGDTSVDLDYQAVGALALNGGTLSDAAGNTAALALVAPGAIGSLAANKALVVDTTAPAFASATISGNALVLTYNETDLLDATHVAGTGAFAVVVGGANVAVNTVAVNAVARTITLTLAASASAGQLVTLAYSDPTAGDDANAIQDAIGNDAASFAATAVTNTTPAPGPAANSPGSGAGISLGGVGVFAPRQGDTLNVNTQSLTDLDGLGALSYQWLRDGVAIAGARDTTYTLGVADVNTRISVAVSYTDGAGKSERVLSGETALITDNDGIPDSVESQAPAPLLAGMTGDGNGDGLLDSLQAEVTSVQVPRSGGQGGQTFFTLVADSLLGQQDLGDGNRASITGLQAGMAPSGLPAALSLTGLLSFGVNVGEQGIHETFSLFVDSDIGANGYWVRDSAGIWNNLATAMQTVGSKTRIDFTLVDGGAFDADGIANGLISNTGSAGFMPLSLLGVSQAAGNSGFWF
jgi:regulation of enolase protein 1 (concanavalin A-like superfamily)